MDQKLRTYLAELIGTFLVVLVAAGTVCAAQLTWLPGLDVTGIALAYGFAYGVVLTVVYPLSAGCLNPAVTLMLWVLRRLDGRPTFVLIAMQLLGAALAGLVLRLTFKQFPVLDLPDYHVIPHLSRAFPRSGELGTLTFGGLVSGTAWELLFTFLVTLALLATVLEPRTPRPGGGILAGLAQVAVTLFGYHLTGGSANPARWFGPAVWQPTVQGAEPLTLTDALIYMGGPVLGALAAALVYHVVIQPPHKRPEHRR
jgi:glycerol uptake facilitator-like aquaporin